MIGRILCIVIPIAVAPLLVAALRPLFALFLRQGTELFTDISLKTPLSLGIGKFLAVVNVVIFIVFWSATFSCHWADGPNLLGTCLAVGGVLIAFVATIRIIRERVGINGSGAVLVGAVTFAGGNLPLMLAIPVLLLVF